MINKINEKSYSSVVEDFRGSWGNVLYLDGILSVFRSQT